MATGGTGSLRFRFLRFRFLCGIRGYHQYRSMWVPTVNEMLRVEPEISNPHDMYAIATKKRFPGFSSDSVVGHLPREVSRITHFIILHGGRVSCRVTDAHHRRSPLVTRRTGDSSILVKKTY